MPYGGKFDHKNSLRNPQNPMLDDGISFIFYMEHKMIMRVRIMVGLKITK